jgi:1,4-alpha-glucan branching enzyme
MAKKASEGNKVGGKAAAPKAAKAAFQMIAPVAQSVSVAGSFNNWQPEAMKGSAKGVWTVSLSLMPGTYEYKFVVDGNWIPDPDCKDNRGDNHGGVNSVRVV